MPVEIIGELGTPGADPEWISAQATLGIRHIVKICGRAPREQLRAACTTSPGIRQKLSENASLKSFPFGVQLS